MNSSARHSTQSIGAPDLAIAGAAVVRKVHRMLPPIAAGMSKMVCANSWRRLREDRFAVGMAGDAGIDQPDARRRMSQGENNAGAVRSLSIPGYSAPLHFKLQLSLRGPQHQRLFAFVAPELGGHPEQRAKDNSAVVAGQLDDA